MNTNNNNDWDGDILQDIHDNSPKNRNEKPGKIAENANPRFIGEYVNEMRRIFEYSAISGENAMVISSPGWGKTDIALTLSRAMVGSDATLLIEIDPSTPPETIRGSYDPAQLLNGKIARIYTDTPYDPAKRIVILDELWRGSDILFDSLIHATNQKMRTFVERPVFWGLSNFVGKAERTDALRDRFAMWYHPSTQLDARAIVLSHRTNGFDESTWSNPIDWETIREIRNVEITVRAANVLADLIEELIKETARAQMDVNPRRVVQWENLLRAGCLLETGNPDFDAIPANVSRILKYAYPASDKQTAAQWAKIAASIVDSVGAAIESYKAIAYDEFLNITKTTNPQDRTAMIGKLGAVLANAQENLQRVGGNDPRIPKTVKELTDWFSRAVRGESLE